VWTCQSTAPRFSSQKAELLRNRIDKASFLYLALRCAIPYTPNNEPLCVSLHLSFFLRTSYLRALLSRVNACRRFGHFADPLLVSLWHTCSNPTWFLRCVLLDPSYLVVQSLAPLRVSNPESRLYQSINRPICSISTAAGPPSFPRLLHIASLRLVAS
jgi:hypothetical protein